MDWRSRAHDAARAGHLPARRRAVSSRALDYENHKAFVRKVAPDYFTDAMTYTRVSVIEEDQARAAAARDLHAGLGRGVASSRRSSATRRSSSTRTRTPATATCACPRCRCTRRVLAHRAGGGGARACGAPRPAVIDALRGIAIALRTVACVGLMSDPRDLGHDARAARTTPDGPPRKDGGVGFDPDALPLRQRARGSGPGRAPVRPARGAAAPRAAAAGVVRLRGRVPRVHRPRGGYHARQRAGGRPSAQAARTGNPLGARCRGAAVGEVRRWT